MKDYLLISHTESFAGVNSSDFCDLNKLHQGSMVIYPMENMCPSHFLVEALRQVCGITWQVVLMSFLENNTYPLQNVNWEWLLCCSDVMHWLVTKWEFSPFSCCVLCLHLVLVSKILIFSWHYLGTLRSLLWSQYHNTTT